MTPGAMIPVLAKRSRGIVASIDIVDPRIFCRRIEAVRPPQGGIATIGELLQGALTTIGASDPHH
jgi:hypothetical protein